MASFAQTVEEQKKKIASIKKNSNYIYAEVTTTDQQQAIDLATEMLHNNVNEWAAKKKKFAGSSKIITKNTNYDVEQITMPRANMFRAFMYVKKSDIIPAENSTMRENAGKKDIYGTKSELSSTTNISSLGMTSLEGNTDMRYSFERRPVFINGKKVAYLNEKQLTKMYKKKSAIVKEYFATHKVDPYSMEQATELYHELIK
jgi:hypothetical protein